MEVSGKKVTSELCKPCEERKISNYAGGLCTQCAERMCKLCFDTHKQFKFNRGHQWVNAGEATSSEEQSVDNILCDKHSSMPIKYFCPCHEQVGCDDCMILDHTPCKVEYIRNLINGCEGNVEYKQIQKDVEKKRSDANSLKTSFKQTKEQIKDVNQMFKRDVNMFKDELISHITKLANSLLKYGDEITAADLRKMDSLEKENESLISEISNVNDVLQSLTKQPYKMFVTSVDYKKKLQDQLDRIKGKHNFASYAFKRDEIMEQLLLASQEIGKLQKDGQTDNTEEAATSKVSANSKRQPLLARQLFCRNLNVNGDCISYMPNERNGVGLYVDNTELYIGFCYEVEILSMSISGSIALGVVPNKYPDNLVPGLGKSSTGYHSDSKIYKENASQKKTGKCWSIGDHIGCKIVGNKYGGDSDVTFTHNGKEIDTWPLFRGMHVAVGMKSKGDKVKVIV